MKCINDHEYTGKICPICSPLLVEPKEVNSSAILVAIDDLISQESQSTDPGKYKRIGKLAQHGSGLRELYARRVKDIGSIGEEIDEGGTTVMVGGENNYAIMQPRRPQPD